MTDFSKYLDKPFDTVISRLLLEESTHDIISRPLTVQSYLEEWDITNAIYFAHEFGYDALEAFLFAVSLLPPEAECKNHHEELIAGAITDLSSGTAREKLKSDMENGVEILTLFAKGISYGLAGRFVQAAIYCRRAARKTNLRGLHELALYYEGQYFIALA